MTEENANSVVYAVIFVFYGKLGAFAIHIGLAGLTGIPEKTSRKSLQLKT
ncbi:MAG: hypothetical protein KJ017_11285 [Alphaproteobacteria bacterium]|nr:hypothetical protein [Alphaproteobacteria bacterium]